MGKRTKSSKAKKEWSDDESEMFTGGKDGISWHEFDSIMGDWLMENYGSRFGEQLWSDKWIDLMKLDLSDDTDEYEYEQYKSMVRDVLTEKSPKMAEMIIKNKEFKTIKWHLQWRVRQHEKLYLQLKKTTDGEAHRLIHEAGYKNMNGIRNKLMMRFANIQSAQLKERQKLYMAGMPSYPGKPMFEEDCNMEKVLDKMEKMRKYLYDMCPKEERESNEHAKESTLVRIISDNLPAQHQAAWDRLEMQMTMIKLAAGESEAGKLDSATDTTPLHPLRAQNLCVKICVRISPPSFVRNMFNTTFSLITISMKTLPQTNPPPLSHQPILVILSRGRLSLSLQEESNQFVMDR
jgi:hypothetical protein